MALRHMATNYQGFEKLSSLGWLTSITFISGTFVLVSHWFNRFGSSIPLPGSAKHCLGCTKTHAQVPYLFEAVQI